MYFCSDDWDIYWCDVGWMKEFFDHCYMEEHVRICHFRNHYEVKLCSVCLYARARTQRLNYHLMKQWLYEWPARIDLPTCPVYGARVRLDYASN